MSSTCASNVYANVDDISAYTPRTVTVNEVESNDSFENAQIIQTDYTVTGYISSATDVDRYQITFPYAGYANFWAGELPDDPFQDYDLYLYDSTGLLVEVSNGTDTAELISNYYVAAGSTYYVEMNGFDGAFSTSQSYKLRAKLYLEDYAYFSQNPLNSNTTNMDILYNVTPRVSWKTRLINAGCGICSYAMILNNMGKTSKYLVPDVRTASVPGQSFSSAYLAADPYSVIWASSGRPSITYDATTGLYETTSTRDPVNTGIDLIAYAFDTNYIWYQFSSSDDATYKKQVIAYLLSQYPQGICLYFSNSSSTHMIVATETTYQTPASITLPAVWAQSGTVSAANTLDETFTELTEEDRLQFEA